MSRTLHCDNPLERKVTLSYTCAPERRGALHDPVWASFVKPSSQDPGREPRLLQGCAIRFIEPGIASPANVHSVHLWSASTSLRCTIFTKPSCRCGGPFLESLGDQVSPLIRWPQGMGCERKMTQTGSPVIDRPGLSSAATLAGWVLFIISVVVLTGWAFDLPDL
jgi:hypothetical protein